MSAALHGATLLSLDRVGMWNDAKILRQEEEVLRQAQSKLQFEFVEAPAKVHPQAPEKPKKISDRDALNQDMTEGKSKAEELPATKLEGLADQLAQKRGSGAESAPVPEVKPSVIARSPQATEATPEEIASSAPSEPARNDISVEQKPQPPQTAKPPVEGLTGQDKITTQETGRVKSSGAQLQGMTSFEATGSGMGAYMKNMKERIWLAWFPYLAYKYPMDFRGADAVVSVLLSAKGEVKIVRLLESDGNELFSTFCMEAVQRAGGFGPLPSEILTLLGKEELE
ncbi:MAG: hypothetical protein ACREH5_01325, partial [Candidatus Omnitrophota bacterium]